MTDMEITDIITWQNVMNILGIVGILFGVYNMWLRGQKEDGDKITTAEKNEIILAKDIQLLRSDMMGEINKMSTQIHTELKNMTMALDHIKVNDLHSIFEKQRDQDSQINKLTVEIGKLTTVIDERVPRKTVEQVT